MSRLFNVSVTEVSGTHVRLTLVTDHPHAGPFGADAVFALRLLHDTAFKLDGHLNYTGLCPLGEAVSFDETMDEDWVHANAARFISAVTVQPPGLPDEVPTGTVVEYEIEVTDPKWVQHLSNGQTWGSAAFS